MNLSMPKDLLSFIYLESIQELLIKKIITCQVHPDSFHTASSLINYFLCTKVLQEK